VTQYNFNWYDIALQKKSMLRSIRIFVLLVLFSIQNQFVDGQIQLSGADYTQDFMG
jgi:hypothetical protein